MPLVSPVTTLVPSLAGAPRSRPPLGFAVLDTLGKPAPPEVQTVRRWLDNRTGVGHIVTGMQREDYDLELTRYDARGWRPRSS